MAASRTITQKSFYTFFFLQEVSIHFYEQMKFKIKPKLFNRAYEFFFSFFASFLLRYVLADFIPLQHLLVSLYSWNRQTCSWYPGFLHSIFSQTGMLFFQITAPLYHSDLQAHISVNLSQFSHSVMSDSLRSHESQHTRPPCPSPSPGIHSNSCPSSRWCHPAISSSVIPFSSCPQSLPESESFPMRWPKYWSFSFSIIPSKEHPGLIFRMDWLDLLAVQGTLKSLLPHRSSKHQFFSTQLSS